MLHLSTGVNTIYINVSDMVIVTTPIYLFRFKHSKDNTEYLVELSNELPANDRTDKFTLTLPTDADLQPGKLELTVYESELIGDEDYESMRILNVYPVTMSGDAYSDTTYETNDGTDTVYQTD